MMRTPRAIGWLLLLLVTSSPAWAVNPWVWQPKTLELHGENVSFEWAVPKLLSSPGDTAEWQKLLDHEVADRLNEFENAYEQARQENARLLLENPDYRPKPWESSGGYQAVWEDPRHLVLLWKGYDYRGGAHGLPVLKVTVLSTEHPDSLLPPSSLFRDDASVLEVLSSASRQSLREQMAQQRTEVDEWMLKGTEPGWQNFGVVYPTRVDGPPRFEVIFPSYQVAPYAAGTPTVQIPWELLSPFAPSLQDGVPLP
jgi:hypothetical protein